MTYNRSQPRSEQLRNFPRVTDRLAANLITKRGGRKPRDICTFGRFKQWRSTARGLEQYELR